MGRDAPPHSPPGSRRRDARRACDGSGGGPSAIGGAPRRDRGDRHRPRRSSGMRTRARPSRASSEPGTGAPRRSRSSTGSRFLARFIPEWAGVRCRPQRDPYHRFTVDAHLTSTLRAMARSLAGEGAADDPVQAEAVKQISDPDPILLGALLHDIGKNGEGGHVPVGARVVGSILDRMGVEPNVRDLVRFMVAQHLLLPDTATRRDLSDENIDPRRRRGGRILRATGGAVSARQGRCGGDRPRRLDPVAAHPDPGAGGEGPARPRSWRDGHRARGGAHRPGRPGPRPPRRESPIRTSTGSSGGCPARTS